jgi:hypothetical protein
MVVPYSVKGDSFVEGRLSVWSERQLANVGLFENYDISPERERAAVLLLAQTPEERNGENRVVFLENFFDELRRRFSAPGK